MLKNFSKIMFWLIMMSGSMIVISANSWLAAWMGLEINLLAFIPLMIVKNNLMTTESSLKYFLIQAMASSVLLLAIMMFYMNNNTQLIMCNLNMEITMTMSALLMKVGAAPFHFWFPAVMEGLMWTTSLVMMTWQKIAPLMLMSYLILSPMLNISVLMSVIVGSLGGLNQTSLRKIMAFSSINHLGWMMMAMYSNENLWINYLLIYSFLSSTLIFIFNINKTLHINQLLTMYSWSKPLKLSMMINLLSMGGLPPFMGFLPKWLVIQYMVNNNQMFTMTTMTVLTLITLYFYIRLCYSSFMLNHIEQKSMINNIKPSFHLSLLLMTFISMTGLTMVSLLYSTN